ncbi:MAG: hypothetical protein U0Q16_35075 [Bryobacteraceae bacterium]
MSSKASSPRARQDEVRRELIAVDAIERLIAKQASIGLQSATDGELRRAMWHYDFLEAARWVAESFHRDHGIAFSAACNLSARDSRH